MLAGFSDPEGGQLAVANLASPDATVRDRGDGSFLLTPSAGFTGTLSLNYDVRDTDGSSIAAHQALSIEAVNHAPVAVADAISLAQDTTITIAARALLANNSDADGDRLVITGTTAINGGSAVLNSDGTISFKAQPGFVGEAHFAYSATDGHGLSATATVTATVTPVDKGTPPAGERPTTPPVTMNGGLIFVQRAGTSGALNYTGDAARVLKDGQLVVDWSKGGSISGIPQGDGYTLEVKSGAVVASAPLAVGVVVETIGQSNMLGWYTAPSTAYDHVDSVYQWIDGGTSKASVWGEAYGAGALAFADTLREELGGVPIALVNGSMAGTRLTSAGKAPSWSDTGAGTLYGNALAQLQKASGGHAELVIWNQGEADAGAKVTAADYANALKALMNRVAADMNQPYFMVSGLAFNQSGADAIRAGQAMAVAGNANAAYIPTATAIETLDGTHLTSVSHVWQSIDVGEAALDHLLPGHATIGVTSGGASGTSLSGSGRMDRMEGGAGADSFWGVGGNDVLRGGAGDDMLDGGAGNDALSGGIGADSLIGGSGNDDLFGDAGNDRLYGGDGADTLNGGANDDAMFGGAGDDSYTVDSAADRISEDDATGGDAGGLDTAFASVSFVLPHYVENLTLTGMGAINGTGNELANIISGLGTNNILSGMGGDDLLLGQAGDDTLYGGDGADRLDGGHGQGRHVRRRGGRLLSRR